MLPAPAGLRSRGNQAGEGSLHPRLLEVVFVLAAFGKGGNESRGSATGVMSPLVRVPLSSGTGAVGLLLAGGVWGVKY